MPRSGGAIQFAIFPGSVTADGISRNSVYRDFYVFASFGLPTWLDADQGPVSDPSGDNLSR